MSRSVANRSPAQVQSLIVIILDRIAGGLSLPKACREVGLAHGNVWPLIAKGHWQEYQAAVLHRAQLWAEELIDLADDASQDTMTDDKGNPRGNMAAVARSRLQVDARKWLLSKLIPKQYGDQLALTGADGGPLEIRWAQQEILDVMPNAIEAEQPKMLEDKAS